MFFKKLCRVEEHRTTIFRGFLLTEFELISFVGDTNRDKFVIDDLLEVNNHRVRFRLFSFGKPVYEKMCIAVYDTTVRDSSIRS